MNTTLCNMVMIEAGQGRAFVQPRLVKITNSWCELTFTGGHGEMGKSVTGSDHLAVSSPILGKR